MHMTGTLRGTVCEEKVDDCSLLISSVLQQTNKVSHSTGEKCTSWYKIRLQHAIKSANLVDCFSYCRCWSPGKRIFPILWVEVDFSTWPLGPAISLKAVATREKGHFHHICCRLSYERVCFWAKSIWRIRRPPFFFAEKDWYLGYWVVILYFEFYNCAQKKRKDRAPTYRCILLCF